MGIIDVLLITCFYIFFSFPKTKGGGGEIKKKKRNGFENQNISLTGQFNTLPETQGDELRPGEFYEYVFYCPGCISLHQDTDGMGGKPPLVLQSLS